MKRKHLPAMQDQKLKYRWTAKESENGPGEAPPIFLCREHYTEHHTEHLRFRLDPELTLTGELGGRHRQEPSAVP